MKRLYLAGLSHKTAPIEWREHFFLPEERWPTLFERAKNILGADEVVALSTCNRVEIYAVAERDDFDAALRKELTHWRGDPALEKFLYHKMDGDAVAHLLSVSAGLDSLVMGENEILGQVRRAYQVAHAHGATGKLSNVLFQRALYVGKLVRTETGLSEGALSVPTAAVALAQRFFGDLGDNTVLVLGAGTVAELSLSHLKSQKPKSLCVINRTLSKAQELAKRFDGTAAPFQNLSEELSRADIVLCSTGSADPVVRYDDLAEVVRGRRGRPLFLIDMAVPRDVDPRCHSLPDVYLYNIDDLKGVVADNLTRREASLAQAQVLVERKSQELTRWLNAWQKGETPPLHHRHTGGDPSAEDAVTTP